MTTGFYTEEEEHLICIEEEERFEWYEEEEYIDYDEIIEPPTIQEQEEFEECEFEEEETGEHRPPCNNHTICRPPNNICQRRPRCPKPPGF